MILFQSNNACPVCGNKGDYWCTAMDWEYRSTNDQYTYLKCSRCVTIFISEVPQQALAEIYPSNYYSFAKKSGRAIFKLKNAWDQLFFRKILKSIPGDSLSVLDIGGGTGEVTDMLKGADGRIDYSEIVDIDKNSGTEASRKGHHYICTPIEAYSTDRKFDVILLLNIIEHVQDPKALLEKADRLLGDNGVIIIKTPNNDSLDARLFRRRYWGGLHCPRHWILFSDRSIKQMIDRTGLRLRTLKFTQGAPFWTWSIIQLFRKKDIHQKKEPLIEHPLFGPLSIVFAAIDIVRSLFFKTSQMFIVLSK